jgi:hypothetical protein
VSDSKGDLAADRANAPTAVATLQFALGNRGYPVTQTGAYGDAIGQPGLTVPIDQLAIPETESSWLWGADAMSAPESGSGLGREQLHGAQFEFHGGVPAPQLG